MPQVERKVGRFRAWTKRLTLRQRILAVNIFAIAILFGSIFYLDSFRTRLTQARVEQAQMRVAQIDDELIEALERWELLGSR